LRDALHLALIGARRESEPADFAEIAIHVGGVVRLIGMDWSQSTKDDCVEAVSLEFQDDPGVILLDALTRARRMFTGRYLAPWIWSVMEPRVTALRNEIKILERLCELGGIEA
jgi:hypothetical protein